MKSFNLAAVFVLTLIIANVRCDCTQGGCECGESCVDSDNTWCKSDKREDCSCKKGCMLYDILLEFEEEKTVYCNDVYCAGTGSIFSHTMNDWCFPEEWQPDVNYPSNWSKDQYCKK